MTTDYNSQADKWVRNEPKTFSDVVARPLVLEFVKEHGKGKVILDIGCGEGYFSRMVVDRTECERVVGVEKSKRMFNLAEKQEKENPKGIIYFNEDALNMISIPAGTIDMCVANAVAHYFKPEQLPKFYGEISRVLKEDGKFGICIPHPRYYPAKDWNGPALHFHPKDFDYEKSRGRFFEGKIETLDRKFLNVGYCHSTMKDHAESIYNGGLTVDWCTEPVLTEEQARKYPKFKEMTGEKVYLIILGSKMQKPALS